MLRHFELSVTFARRQMTRLTDCCLKQKGNVVHLATFVRSSIDAFTATKARSLHRLWLERCPTHELRFEGFHHIPRGLR
jgi:hypothetical protein